MLILDCSVVLYASSSEKLSYKSRKCYNNAMDNGESVANSNKLFGSFDSTTIMAATRSLFEANFPPNFYQHLLQSYSLASPSHLNLLAYASANPWHSSHALNSFQLSTNTLTSGTLFESTSNDLPSTLTPENNNKSKRCSNSYSVESLLQREESINCSKSSNRSPSPSATSGTV